MLLCIIVVDNVLGFGITLVVTILEFGTGWWEDRCHPITLLDRTMMFVGIPCGLVFDDKIVKDTIRNTQREQSKVSQLRQEMVCSQVRL